MWQLLQSLATNDDPARVDDEAELQAQNTQRGFTRDARQVGPPRDRRHSCRYARQRIRAARRTRHPMRLSTLEHTSDDAVRHWGDL